nr:transposase family protein [Micromonospora sp. DSM 115978]
MTTRRRRTEPPPHAPIPRSCPRSPRPADLRTLGDLGYEGLADTVTVAFKRPTNGGLPLVQQQFNKAHNALRAIGERGNSLLKMTFRALPTAASTGGGSENRRRRAAHPPHRARAHHDNRLLDTSPAGERPTTAR